MKKTAQKTLRLCVSARGIFILIITAILMIAAAPASAANYVVSWDAANFAAVNSDLADSGYRVYESTDNGATKTLMATVPPDTRTHPFSRGAISGSCFYVDSFNQWGTKGFSAAYCTNCPDIPTGVTVMLQEIVGAIQKFLGTD